MDCPEGRASGLAEQAFRGRVQIQHPVLPIQDKKGIRDAFYNLFAGDWHEIACPEPLEAPGQDRASDGQRVGCEVRVIQREYAEDILSEMHQQGCGRSQHECDRLPAEQLSRAREHLENEQEADEQQDIGIDLVRPPSHAVSRTVCHACNARV